VTVSAMSQDIINILSNTDKNYAHSTAVVTTVLTVQSQYKLE